MCSPPPTRCCCACCAQGLIDGLRVDHPDGLADPRGYLARLATETGGAWVVVEKILAHGEELPDWPCAGTTGYDALALVGGLFTDPAGDVPLTEEYVRFTGGWPPPRSRVSPRWSGRPSTTSPTAPSPPSCPG